MNIANLILSVVAIAISLLSLGYYLYLLFWDDKVQKQILAAKVQKLWQQQIPAPWDMNVTNTNKIDKGEDLYSILYTKTDDMVDGLRKADVNEYNHLLKYTIISLTKHVDELKHINHGDVREWTKWIKLIKEKFILLKEDLKLTITPVHYTRFLEAGFKDSLIKEQRDYFAKATIKKAEKQYRKIDFLLDNLQNRVYTDGTSYLLDNFYFEFSLEIYSPQYNATMYGVDYAWSKYCQVTATKLLNLKSTQQFLVDPMLPHEKEKTTDELINMALEEVDKKILDSFKSDEKPREMVPHKFIAKCKKHGYDVLIQNASWGVYSLDGVPYSSFINDRHFVSKNNDSEVSRCIYLFINQSLVINNLVPQNNKINYKDLYIQVMLSPYNNDLEFEVRKLTNKNNIKILEDNIDDSLSAYNRNVNNSYVKFIQEAIKKPQ